jgi:hypothetical protein
MSERELRTVIGVPQRVSAAKCRRRNPDTEQLVWLLWATTWRDLVRPISWRSFLRASSQIASRCGFPVGMRILRSALTRRSRRTRDDVARLLASPLGDTQMRTALLLIALAAASALAQDVAPVPLGDAKSFPVEYAGVLVAAAAQLKSEGFQPSEFRGRIESCSEEACEISVYPHELDSVEYRNKSYRGCPLKYCASMTYSKQSERITRVVHWR